MSAIKTVQSIVRMISLRVSCNADLSATTHTPPQPVTGPPHVRVCTLFITPGVQYSMLLMITLYRKQCYACFNLKSFAPSTEKKTTTTISTTWNKKTHAHGVRTMNDVSTNSRLWNTWRCVGLWFAPVVYLLVSKFLFCWCSNLFVFIGLWNCLFMLKWFLGSSFMDI